MLSLVMAVRSANDASYGMRSFVLCGPP